MRDVWKCFLTGVLCLWLFSDAIDIHSPAVKIEEGTLKEWKEETDREIFGAEDSGRKEMRIYLNQGQEVEIHISWIAKGCILLLFFGVIKKAH